MAEIAKKAVFDALEMCAVEEQNGCVRYVALLAVESFIGDVLDKYVDARQFQKAAMRAIVDPVMFQAVTGALLKGDQSLGLLAAFVFNYVEKEAGHVRRDEDRYESVQKVQKSRSSPSTSNHSDNDGKGSRDN